MKLDKRCWFAILRAISEALARIHEMGFLHNDLKSNNVVMERRGEGCNPVSIDFGKARRIDNPKSLKALPQASQLHYKHIAPEIVQGQASQSVRSDIYSLGKLLLEVLDIIPTVTCSTLTVAKKALCDEPAGLPLITQLLEALQI